MNEFISKFVNHLRDDIGYPEPKIARFKHAIRKFLTETAVERDEEHAIVIRSFAKPRNFSFSFMNDDLWIGTKEDSIYVGVQRPIWSTGIRSLSKDEDVRDTISWFLHFSEQYVMRAYHVSVIGAINLVYDVEADFMGDRIISYMDGGGIHESYTGFVGQNLVYSRSRSSRDIGIWISMINAFDPMINRMIYNYNKAISLRDNLFWEEAIVACDKTVNVVEQFYKRIQYVDNSVIRKELVEFFLDESYNIVFERLYELRCYFGAHPSSSKWWDFAEIYDDELDNTFEAVKSLLMSVFRYESNNRIPAYSYNDKTASEWLRQNLNELFQACWFSDLP